MNFSQYYFGVKNKVITKDEEYEYRLQYCKNIEDVAELIVEIFKYNLPEEFLMILAEKEYGRLVSIKENDIQEMENFVADK